MNCSVCKRSINADEFEELGGLCKDCYRIILPTLNEKKLQNILRLAESHQPVTKTLENGRTIFACYLPSMMEVADIQSDKPDSPKFNIVVHFGESGLKRIDNFVGMAGFYYASEYYFVKTQIAKQKAWNDSSKVLAVYAYDAYCTMEGLTWKKPTYRQEEATIWLPQSETDFDQLISYTHSPRLRAFLQALRETYADPSEILGLEWKDLKDDSISISKPCKGHRSGTKTVSPRCIALLRALPKLDDKRIFPPTYKNIYTSFRWIRKRAAKHLKNDQLLNITFKTFRHWAGTQIAYRTNGNGLLTIQKELRHKDIKSTMKYIHNIPDFKEIEYEIATATTDDEIKALGKAGFEKYDEASGVHYYRRIPRKTFGANPK